MIYNRMLCELHRNYQIIILDLNMPIAMGNEVALYVRQREQELKVEKPHFIIASSSLSEKSVEDLRRTKVFSEFMMKPITANNI